MLSNQTIDRLNKLGVPTNSALPKVVIKSLRTSVEVAKRINIFGVFIAICDDPKSIPFFKKLIEEQDMVNVLSKSEKIILNRGKILRQEEIDKSWYQEGLYALSWCLGIIEKIELPQNEANLNPIFPHLPPEIDIKKFVDNAKLIDDQEVLQETEFYYGLHWALRHPESWSILNKLKYKKYNLSIVRERRKSFEWLIDDSLEWDDISLDT